MERFAFCFILCCIIVCSISACAVDVCGQNCARGLPQSWYHHAVEQNKATKLVGYRMTRANFPLCICASSSLHCISSFHDVIHATVLVCSARCHMRRVQISAPNPHRCCLAVKLLITSSTLYLLYITAQFLYRHQVLQELEVNSISEYENAS